MSEYQWNIFWADLNPVRGSEQAGTRPVLIISEEAVNQALPVLTVVCLTTLKPGRKVYPIEVLINPEESGLPQASIVMAYQLGSIAKDRLAERCGYIADEEIRASIKEALKVHLDLL